jgi:pimeloyl-ACP methyl ester carboxylesterase
MANGQSVGPYEILPVQGGAGVPLYLIPFDKEGRCQGPLTLAHLLEEAGSGRYTDVHVFSHGWNNLFKDAIELYRAFFAGYLSLRQQHGLMDEARYRPLFVGIIWPSTALALPWERPPRIAAAGADPVRDEETLREARELEEVAAAVAPEAVGRLYELAEAGRPLTAAEAEELARILLPIHARADGEAGAATGSGAATADELLQIWASATPSADAGRPPGFAEDEPVPAQPAPAAWLADLLDPRRPIQLATVLLMKDRAGTVGARGVGEQIVRPLVAQGSARVHLVGHSYGGKVVLSALSYPELPAKVTSLLLLQPAVSYLCFAERVGDEGGPGGYRNALDRVERPILCTFSRQDDPLTKFFHLAVRRASDLGDQRIAGAPPSRFAALGGFGPGGLPPGESRTIPMPAPPEPYPGEEAGVRIYGVDGSSGQIRNHSDVRTPYTAWAHLTLVTPPPAERRLAG